MSKPHLEEKVLRCEYQKKSSVKGITNMENLASTSYAGVCAPGNENRKRPGNGDNISENVGTKIKSEYDKRAKLEDQQQVIEKIDSSEKSSSDNNNTENKWVHDDFIESENSYSSGSNIEEELKPNESEDNERWHDDSEESESSDSFDSDIEEEQQEEQDECSRFLKICLCDQAEDEDEETREIIKEIVHNYKSTITKLAEKYCLELYRENFWRASGAKKLNIADEMRYMEGVLEEATKNQSQEKRDRARKKVDEKYKELQDGRLCYSEAISLVFSLIIHSVECTKALKECLPCCDELRNLLHEHCEKNFSRCSGKVVFSNTHCFARGERMRISYDFNIFCAEKIGEGRFGLVWYQWLKRNQQQAAMAAKQTGQNITADLLLTKNVLHDEFNILFPQIIMQIDTSGMVIMQKGVCSLYDYIQHFHGKGKMLPEAVAALYIQHILNAVNTLHGVYRLHHGDIKTKNIILMDNYYRAVLADFDTLKSFGVETESSEIGGTLGYIPYECLDRQRVILDGSIDIYGFGMVAAALLTTCNMEIMNAQHDNPKKFMLKNNIDIVNHIKKNRSATVDFANLVEQCIQESASMRPSSAQLKENYEKIFQDYRQQILDLTIPTIEQEQPSTFNSLEGYLKHIIKKHLPTLKKEFPSRRSSAVPYEQYYRAAAIS